MLINSGKNSEASLLLLVFLFTVLQRKITERLPRKRRNTKPRVRHACMHEMEASWEDGFPRREVALTGILFLRRPSKLAVNLPLFPSNNCRLLFAILSFLHGLNYAWERRRAPPPSGSQGTLTPTKQVRTRSSPVSYRLR